MHKSLVSRKKDACETKREPKGKLNVHLLCSDGEQSAPGDACRQLPDAARQKVQGRGLTLAGLGVQASKEEDQGPQHQG